ncbi:hypothetical protein H6A23_00955 [Olsenella uli]|uniref:hypothetical protein n=1 Tax=Olsenella uli TaxID=133926 RepID=UPI00195AB997|nr:hypothetical protein [Olsenella uli]MBM6815730.1 hypothetical protein [Olsenella uli]
MRRTRIGILAIAAALAASLGACGGGSGGVDIPSLESLKEGFVGTWEIESATSTDGDITAEDIDAMNELGMNVTVDLGDDGTMLIDVFGDQTTGTWEIKDEDTLTLSIEDEPLDAPVADGTLTLSYEGQTMTFEKADDEPNMDRDPSENSGGVEGMEDELEDQLEDVDDVSDVGSDMEELFSPESDLAMTAYAEGVTVDAPLDITVADDETALIKVTGVGTDYEGDTGYLVTVENRTGANFVAMNFETAVDGQYVDDYATLVRPVPAGESRAAFFFFDASAVSVSADSSCTATIMLFDESLNPVGMYDLAI